MTKVNIIYAGPFVSVQDAGRPGYMRFGVPRSGPMDRVAFSILKAALKAGDDFAAIEVSLGGLTLKNGETPLTAGFVGGGFLVELDGEPQPAWGVFTIPANAALSIRPGASGSWGYLGFSGEIHHETWLGSQAMHLTSGLCGTPLSAGETLTVADPTLRKELNCTLPIPDFARFRDHIRIVLGPQDFHFSLDSVAALTNAPFTVTPSYDRMGMRLSGTKLIPEAELTMPSEALVRGSVQVPGHGDPIILLADHQTTGGYPKIATVITADQDHLVQARAQDKIHFIQVSVEDAIRDSRLFQSTVDAYLDKIDDYRGSLTDRLLRFNLISGVVGTD